MVRARIRVDGELAAVCRRFWGRRCRPAMAGLGERDGGIGHGKTHSRTGPGASWRGGSKSQWRTCTVRRGEAALGIVLGRD